MKFLIVSRTFSSVSIAWTGEPGGRTNSHCPGVALACRCSTVMPTSVNARTTCSIRSKRSKSSSVIQDHEWDWLNGIYVIVPLLCHLGFINTTSTTKPINGEKKKVNSLLWAREKDSGATSTHKIPPASRNFQHNHTI